MPAPHAIRPVTEDEFAAFEAVFQHAFHTAPLTADARERVLARLEFGRTLAAFDGATMVGTAGAYSLRMRLPGAMADTAGVSLVGVLPSHRRRGILSSLMRRQLDDVHDRGEAVAALFASEAGIYGRFGYGRASWQAGYTLRRGEGALAPGAPSGAGLRLRIAGPETARADLAAVYERELSRRPGLFARTSAWWDHTLADPEPGGQPSPLRCVLAEDDSGPRGYALYSAQERWDDDGFLPEAAMEIREVLATDPAAAAALWSDLLSRDLTSEFHAGARPVDDPLLHLLADPRRVRSRVTDGLWVRLADVGGALAQRRYACPVDAVIEVTDEFCPWNSGRWRLTAGTGPGRAGATGPGATGPGDGGAGAGDGGPGDGGPGDGGPGDGGAGAGDGGTAAGTGAATSGSRQPEAGFAGSCERTSAPPDAALPARALGAAYLGGTRLGALAAAGVVTERRPGAVAALSAALSWDPAPWCPTVF